MEHAVRHAPLVSSQIQVTTAVRHVFLHAKPVSQTPVVSVAQVDTSITTHVHSSATPQHTSVRLSSALNAYLLA